MQRRTPKRRRLAVKSDNVPADPPAAAETKTGAPGKGLQGNPPSATPPPANSPTPEPNENSDPTTPRDEAKTPVPGDGAPAASSKGPGKGHANAKGQKGVGTKGVKGMKKRKGPMKKKGSIKKNDSQSKGPEKVKKKEKKVVWGPGTPDYTFEKAIPLGCDLFALRRDGLYHHVRVLEVKPKEKHFKQFAEPSGVQSHAFVYYVHYKAFNRRMDEWVPRHTLKFKQDITEHNNTPGAVKWEVSTAEHAPDDGDHGDFDEESLKAHEAVTKVKNVDSIVIGKYEMETWYFSPFPANVRQFRRLIFCEFCLSFFGRQADLERHATRCKLRHPPGDEIYRSEEHNVTVAMFEVDGKKETVYCQNLCYIAKLFLDHKTLQYDTEPFLFYILCEVDQYGYHLVGYFSKEKLSDEGYNVACILTLPCHQRKGYGKFLISLSYELSKKERKVGSPEKPLSDLGAVSYRSYWSGVLIEVLKKQKDDISIKKLSHLTSITNDDILSTLRHLGIIKYVKGEHIFHVPAELMKTKPKPVLGPNRIYVRPCDPAKLHWTPFMITSKRHKGAF